MEKLLEKFQISFLHLAQPQKVFLNNYLLFQNYEEGKLSLQHIEFSKLKLNRDNPRCLKKERRNLLIDSLLSFPAMLNARPQVVTADLIIIGGNARQVAIEHIYSLGWSSVRNKIIELYGKLLQRGHEYEECRINSTLLFWENFFKDKRIPVFVSNSFTDSESKEFVIKDNLCVSEWDMDILSAMYDTDILLDYGFEPYELGICLSDTDMELMPNVLRDAINQESFQLTFTFPIEHKAKFEGVNKKDLENILLEYVNGINSSK